MSEKFAGGRGAGPTQRSVEIGVAVAMAVFALIVIVGSVQVGIGWGAEGPKAGFVPVLCRPADPGLEHHQSRRGPAPSAPTTACSPNGGSSRKVMSILVPTAIYVALIPWIGIYVASVMLIAVFMRWLGRYGWGMIAARSRWACRS